MASAGFMVLVRALGRDDGGLSYALLPQLPAHSSCVLNNILSFKEKYISFTAQKEVLRRLSSLRSDK